MYIYVIQIIEMYTVIFSELFKLLQHIFFLIIEEYYSYKWTYVALKDLVINIVNIWHIWTVQESLKLLILLL